MSLFRFLVAFALTGTLLHAAELVPVEKFAAGFALSQARLSPDGKFFAFIQQTDAGPRLKIVDIETKAVALVDPGKTLLGMQKEIPNFRWVSDQRLSFLTTVWDGTAFTGVSAVNRDGKKWQAYTGPDVSLSADHPLVATQIIYVFGDDEQNVLMLDRGMNRGRDVVYQDVIKVSTLNGVHKIVVENPGNVIGWVVDRQGTVRLGVTREGRRSGLIYRESAGAPWRALPPFAEKLGRITPLGFDPDGHRLVVATSTEKNRRAVYFYDIAAGKLGDIIAEHDEYDVIPEMGAPSVDGVSLAGVISSETTETILGVRFMTDGPRVQWFDASMASLQTAVDNALPNTVNLITSRSRDEKRFLVLAFSDRDPGKYYLLDLKSDKPAFVLLGAQVKDFPVEQMASMFPIKYTARDGQKINGYLTLPVAKRKNSCP